MPDQINIRRRAAAAIQDGDAPAAVAALTQALSQEPGSRDLLLDLGHAQLAAETPDDALASFNRLLALTPRDPAVHRGLGQAHLALGDTSAALAAFRQALAILPYDTYAAHMVAALSGETIKGAGTYVANLFDDHADDFDRHLTQVLHYSIPAQIARLLAPYAPQSLLDLGCGTGLVGAAVRDAIPLIDGIDIAPQMIRKARERGIYRHLRAADFIAALSEVPDFAGRYDAITAADVLVYLGPLEATFDTVTARLAPNGLFALSVETSDTAEVSLRPSGRYAHSAGYITSMAARHGLTIISQTATPIRHERSQPIPGMLFLLRLC